jgi:Spy/CpxP family protein refolding chaperone
MKPKLADQRPSPIADSRLRDETPSLLPPGTKLDLTKTQEQKIRELAYQLYEERGRSDGHDLDDWLEAEGMIRERGDLAA